MDRFAWGARVREVARRAERSGGGSGAARAHLDVWFRLLAARTEEAHGFGAREARAARRAASSGVRGGAKAPVAAISPRTIEKSFLAPKGAPH
jgi:hypothetical protein